MGKVLVVGCGASGMVAAVFAGRRGQEVHIYEKNEKPGKKLFITGKGRCNLTNDCEMDILLSSVQSNAKFLYSAFTRFNNKQAIEFFESLGVKTKVERGNRVFPASGHSSEVIRALVRELERLHVHLHFNSEVSKLLTENGKFSCILLKDGRRIQADSCIVATGGLSYPSTGSTGDGYRFALETGHHVTSLSPALVPIEAKEAFVKNLEGLSLKNVRVRIDNGRKRLYEEFGEMLFTRTGVSGPLILRASSMVGKELRGGRLAMKIDLKPALSLEQLDARVVNDFEKNRNKEFKNAVNRLFPAKLRPVLIALSDVDPYKKVNAVSKEERIRFVKLIKNFQITLTKLKGFEEAVVTKGGVDIRQIKPSRMESKIVQNLFFTGEVLDVDALTGGFNLQIAWSTGYLAGSCA